MPSHKKSFLAVLIPALAASGSVLAANIETTGTNSHTFNQNSDVNLGASDLTIGAGSGTGTLSVSNGATVSDDEGSLGAGSGSNGTATVTGSGSQWINATRFFVGDSGTAALNIENGGNVSDDSGFIGYNATSTGTANVTGSGSSWTSNQGQTIGRYGDGTLNITAGGVVNGDAAVVSQYDGSSGDINIHDAGSSYTLSSRLLLSNENNTSATLDVTNGGNMTSGYAVIAAEAGATGTATITDAGSTWNNNGTLYLGGNESSAGGNATLNVTDSGAVNNTGNTQIYAPGTLNIDGGTYTTQSINSSAGTLNHDDGTLRVDGGSYTFGTSDLLVESSDNTRTATLELNNATQGDAAYGNVLVGDTANTNGALNLSGTSQINATNEIYLGDDATASGSVTVSGASAALSSGNEIQVGRNGTGTLTINNGADVSSGATTHVGALLGSTGTLNIDGTGSTLTATDHVYVGTHGTGTLNVTGGAVVSSTTGSVGRTADGDGTATVNGSGSAWTNTGNFNVGDHGTGALTVSAGGSITNSGLATLGYAVNSSGTVDVTGTNSDWTNTGELHVGRYGTGTLTIADGGSVSNTEAHIAVHDTNSQGTVTVTGAGSSWTNSSVLNVGRDGTGSLTVSAGGNVTNVDAQVGLFSGATGTVNVTGSSSTWTSSGSLGIGGSTSSAGGNGTVTVADNGTVNVTGTMQIWNAGALFINNSAQSTADIVVVNGGNVDVDGDGVLNATNGISITNGANLSGSGTINGALTVGAGGILKPGNSPGTLTVASAAFTNGGTYNVEINDFAGTAGTDPGWDLLDVNGDWDISGLTAGGFTIDVDSLLVSNTAGDAANFDNTQGYSLTILDYNNLVGGFDESLFNINLGGFSNGFDAGLGTWSLALDITNTALLLNYDYDAPSGGAVPIPTPLALFGLGAVLLGQRRLKAN